jgi:hypothetical protein
MTASHETNNMGVIGVGVNKPPSHLLLTNCDFFIFYYDLVRERERAKKQTRKKAAGAATPDTGAKKAPTEADRRQEALDLVLETVEALYAERGTEDKLWGSMVKQALKRRKPGFNETYDGFRSFGKLLEEAQARKLLALEPDEKSGGVIVRSIAPEHGATDTAREA